MLANGVTLTATTASLTTVIGNFLTLSGTNSASFVGNITGNPSSAYSVVNTSSGTLNFTGFTEATGSGGGTFRNQVGGSLIINGGVISGANSFAIYQDAGGNTTVNGYCTSNGVLAVNNNGVGQVTIVGTMTASNGGGNAVRSTNTSSLVRASGSFICASDGTMAVAAIKMILNTTPTNAKTRYALNGTGTYVDMFTADNSLGQAAPANVRSGIVYANGNLTGTCAVPAASSVASGVPVDATTGTAVLTAADVQSALTAQGLTTARAGNLDNLDATVSSRLAPSGTLATVTNLTNAPASVTPAEIRAEMDSNSTKLANLDATVSSRLASSAYTAAPTTAQIATAVEGSLLNEADGQAVLNAIVGAIGNQNLSEVSLVAAVRADLERNGGKLDSIPTTAAPTAAANATAVWATASKTITGGTVDTLTNSPSVPSAASIAAATRSELAVELARVDSSISTRLAGSAYTAPANSDVAAVKAVTDALVVERLNNCATTAIVGNLLAQANS